MTYNDDKKDEMSKNHTNLETSLNQNDDE